MRTLLTDIRGIAGYYESNAPEKIFGENLKILPALHHAWLLVEDGLIKDFGTMDAVPNVQVDDTYSVNGGWVLPAWCDSHTHLVFAGSREKEFVDRINGLSYAEIAARGGGILNSAEKLRETSEEQLFEEAYQRLLAVRNQGTGAIEIKSGYGLDTQNELKMLRVIRRLQETKTLPIRATFLAAHALPKSFKENKEGFLRLIIEEMLPIVAGDGLATYIDAFCEEGFFSVDDTERLIDAAAKYGLKAKIHANQLHHSGGVELGVRKNAVSVDHLECVGEKEINALTSGQTIPTLLPGAAFFLGMHYQPARAMIDAGLPVCLATDYNPGSCPSGNVPLLLTIACTQLKMTPAEAINAVTVNGAAALEWSNVLGSIAKGMHANLLVTKPMEDYAYIPYDYGNNPVARMMIQGRWV